MSKAPIVARWTEIDETFITNVQRGRETPKPGEPWEYFVFGWDVERRRLKSGVREFAKRKIITLTGSEESDVNTQLAALIREGVLVIPEKGRDAGGFRTTAYRVIDVAAEESR